MLYVQLSRYAHWSYIGKLAIQAYTIELILIRIGNNQRYCSNDFNQWSENTTDQSWCNIVAISINFTQVHADRISLMHLVSILPNMNQLHYYMLQYIQNFHILIFLGRLTTFVDYVVLNIRLWMSTAVFNWRTQWVFPSIHPSALLCNLLCAVWYVQRNPPYNFSLNFALLC